MEILVCHLTRMSAARICVAGINLATKQQIRPVLPMGNFTTQDLVENGGQFEIGAIVDIGEVHKSGYPPEVEDHDIRRKNIRRVERVKQEEFVKILLDNCDSSIRRIFGEMMSYDYGYATLKPGEGQASLGCMKILGNSEVHINDKGKIRMRFTDDETRLNIPITDLRCFGSDGQTVNQAAIERLQQITAHNEIIVSLGVTRLYSPRPEVAKAHWLQANGVFPVTEPFWN